MSMVLICFPPALGAQILLCLASSQNCEERQRKIREHDSPSLPAKILAESSTFPVLAAGLDAYRLLSPELLACLCNATAMC